MAIVPFLDKLQNYLPVVDVLHGLPDPPDFMVKTQSLSIGIEVTKSNPKIFKKGGFSKIEEFKRWEIETQTRRLPRSEFEWGTYTLRESLVAFHNEVRRKSKRVRSYFTNFDETWLTIQAEGGSPHGGLTEEPGYPFPGKQESSLNFYYKHLFEIDKICKFATPFKRVIIFCGSKFLSFNCGGSKLKLPEPHEDLLRKGERVSDEYLEWRYKIRSVKRHFTGSVYDIDEWLMNSRYG